MNHNVRTLMNTVAGTGAGSAVLFDKPCRTHAVEISWAVTGGGANKAVAGLVVAFEGSITGTTFQAMDTAITLTAGELTAQYALRFIVDKPCAYMRANPTTVTISGSTGVVTLTIKVLSVE